MAPDLASLHPRRPLGAVVRDALVNPVSRFPKPSHQPERVTGVVSPAFAPSFVLVPGETVFTIGSCFARNVEEQLAAAGFDVPTLDFAVPRHEWQGGRVNGILNKYTPTSIRTELELALGSPDDEAHGHCLVDTTDGSVVDMQLAANTAVPLERGRQRRRQVRELFGKAFTADVVVITLGQTETWWDATTGYYANVFPPAAVHRHHPGRFFFEQLTYDRCLEEMERALQLLLGHGATTRILLSVSPVPMGRTFTGGDALTAYVAAKSVLRVVAETLTARHPEVDYLPAYEAVMLTDRSVAFGPDLHVPDAVVAHVVGAAVAAYTESRHPTVV